MKLIDLFIRYMSYVTAFVLLLLVGLILYDASLRYLFSEGSTALQELEWHFFDVVILLSIAYTLRHNAHVRVDIFYAKFSKKTQLIIDMIATLFFVMPLAMLIIYIGVDFVSMSYLQHEASSDPGGLRERWIVKSLMPLGFFLVLLQSFRELYETLQRFKSL